MTDLHYIISLLGTRMSCTCNSDWHIKVLHKWFCYDDEQIGCLKELGWKCMQSNSQYSENIYTQKDKYFNSTVLDGEEG
jgi:hypothetical protein